MPVMRVRRPLCETIRSRDRAAVASLGRLSLKAVAPARCCHICSSRCHRCHVVMPLLQRMARVASNAHEGQGGKGKKASSGSGPPKQPKQCRSGSLRSGPSQLLVEYTAKAAANGGHLTPQQDAELDAKLDAIARPPPLQVCAPRPAACRE